MEECVRTPMRSQDFFCVKISDIVVFLINYAVTIALEISTRIEFPLCMGLECNRKPTFIDHILTSLQSEFLVSNLIWNF